MEIVKEGVSQAEKRLTDALDTRKQLEQKAFTLLGGYITVSMALFGFAATLGKQHLLFSTLLAMGALFFVGIIFLIRSLRTSDYGTLGRCPDIWLQQGTIDGTSATLATILAYVLYDYDNRIRVSDGSNNTKGELLNYAIMCGASSPAFFCLGILYRFLF